MERTRVLLPGSSLTDPQGPRYYDATDLRVGETVTVFAHQFVLLDADEYVFSPYAYAIFTSRHYI